ncbi:Protein of unknown function [Amphritea atlantica]|uniref:DUF4242 domain-containing protein n=2 Tax=Amphritea TaxID=515417 RepID=A0A1H9M787_9GAMM|nr:nickel-binding protein [Amphritea atlantica]SER19548.1 Protein of unknown function [Amphritea atlantica]
MKKMKLFLDTHDVESGTFPAGITKPQFAEFYEQYKQACEAEGVVPLKIFTGVEAGKAFCLTLAEESDAVARAHQRVGLPFNTITEV